MRETIPFSSTWTFDGTAVDLPHNAVELPFNYFDEKSYQRGFVYEKRFTADPAWAGREVVVHFEGAMADARVYLNGVEVAAHADGYTPFEARLTDGLTEGENLLRVEISGAENPATPPFGGQIDYLCYAGIYRDVWLHILPALSIAGCKIETPDPLADAKSVRVQVTLDNPTATDVDATITGTILDASGATVAETKSTPGAEIAFDGLTGLSLWDIDTPNLYTLRLTLESDHGTDQTETRFGFREAYFNTDGFFLNGRALKIRGLNRHQSFPYIGYALGRAAQERDAEILKFELKLNLVRTSHYPQSRYFLDRCDELGLLVFEEIPGWQHIGDTDWQAKSVENVRAMITRDWNHPSIILWGVRINESPDDHDFYLETNRVAHALDTTRQTGGVRCITDSEFLEDVYTMNDFILGDFDNPLGSNRPRTPLRPQREVTGLDRDVPYMITEYNGHMYPTKSQDQEQRQAEHVIRHLEVLDAAYGAKGTAGAIGWCAFDYNTHKDFGSGDRVCYHGVMDMFREPKFAAYVYKSQCEPEEEAVLKPVTFWTRGERNVHGVIPLIVLTNCDEVEFRYGDFKPVRIAPDRARFPNLPHAPVIAHAHHFTDEGLGEWGMTWEPGEIVGYVDGKEVARQSFVADPLPTTLEVAPDADRIAPGETVRVMIRALDQAGNKLPFCAGDVSIEVTGAGARIGPATSPLRGGSTGFWVKATGAGGITLSISHPRFGTVTQEIAT